MAWGKGFSRGKSKSWGDFGYNKFFKIEGAEKLMKQIKSLDDKLTRRTINKAFKSAAVGLRDQARMYAKIDLSGSNRSGSKPTGNLAKSIGFITGKSKTYPTMYVGPRVKKDRAIAKMRASGTKVGHYDKGGWYGHFVEYGHEKKRLTMKPRYIKSQKRWNTRKAQMDRGDAPAKPFMEPAIRTHSISIELKVVTALKDLVENQLKK